MDTILMKQTKYRKNPDTKTTYILEETETREISVKQYQNITGEQTLKWFRSLGGLESVQRGYTSRGYLITKLTSKNPNRQIKVVREFDFDSTERV